MILEGLHEKEIFTENHPFRLEVNISHEFCYPLHWHNAIELVYISEGSCKVSINGFEHALHEKDILLVPSGEIHDIHANGRGKRYFIQFDLSMLAGFGQSNSTRMVLSHTVKIQSAENSDLHTAFEKLILSIINEYEAKETEYILSLNARVLDLFVLLSRKLDVVNDSESIHNTKKVFGLEKINSSFKYIEANYQYDISLKDVSKAVGFSEYHFSRLFKDIAEKNFHSYLNEFRIKKAEKLLTGSDMSIAQIASSVGFNSFATFNRIFKKIKGCSPTSFRKAGV